MSQLSQKIDPSLVPSPRSRWLINSWTIAALMLGLVVAAMIFGTQTLSKRQFIEGLRVQGAKVVTEPMGPDWLVEWGGADYAQYMNRVTAIDAARVTLSRSDIAYIGTLRHLRTLDLSGTMLTDDDLEVIGRLPTLESVNLRGTRATEMGVENLRQARPGLRVEF